MATTKTSNAEQMKVLLDIQAEQRIQKLDNERQHTEVTNRLGAVEQQVRYTNGRVKALETKSERADAVEQYKQEVQEAQSGSNPKVDWGKWLWFVIALAASLIAIGQALPK